VNRTVLLDGHVVGNVASFTDGHRQVCYWIGREHWEQGIETRALRLLLEIVLERPVYAGAASDNVASIRVLEKCGFVITGEESGYSNTRGCDVQETLLRLSTP